VKPNLVDGREAKVPAEDDKKKAAAATVEARSTERGVSSSRQPRRREHPATLHVESGQISGTVLGRPRSATSARHVRRHDGASSRSPAAARKKQATGSFTARCTARTWRNGLDDARHVPVPRGEQEMMRFMSQSRPPVRVNSRGSSPRSTATRYRGSE